VKFLPVRSTKGNSKFVVPDLFGNFASSFRLKAVQRKWFEKFTNSPRKCAAIHTFARSKRRRSLFRKCQPLRESAQSQVNLVLFSASFHLTTKKIGYAVGLPVYPKGI
jgi:hypothetical protein